MIIMILIICKMIRYYLGQACATLADDWDEGADVGLEL